MIDEIRKRLQFRPFEPFFVVMSSGQRYRVASGERAAVNPKGDRIVIWFDDGGSVDVSRLHISALEKEAAQPASS